MAAVLIFRDGKKLKRMKMPWCLAQDIPARSLGFRNVAVLMQRVCARERLGYVIAFLLLLLEPGILKRAQCPIVAHGRRPCGIIHLRLGRDSPQTVELAQVSGFPSPHSRSEWRGGVRGGGLLCSA